MELIYRFMSASDKGLFGRKQSFPLHPPQLRTPLLLTLDKQMLSIHRYFPMSTEGGGECEELCVSMRSAISAPPSVLPASFMEGTFFPNGFRSFSCNNPSCQANFTPKIPTSKKTSYSDSPDHSLTMSESPESRKSPGLSAKKAVKIPSNATDTLSTIVKTAWDTLSLLKRPADVLSSRWSTAKTRALSVTKEIASPFPEVLRHLPGSIDREGLHNWEFAMELTRISQTNPPQWTLMSRVSVMPGTIAEDSQQTPLLSDYRTIYMVLEARTLPGWN